MAVILRFAVLVVAFILLSQVSTAKTWNNIRQELELKSMRRHKMKESIRLKALNRRTNVSSYGLYPQLTQHIRCLQSIDQDVPPSLQTCSDDACLVEAMYMKTPHIIIDHDLDISNSLPLPRITTNMKISGKCLDHACMINAYGVGQMFWIDVGGQLMLQNLEIKGGYSSEGGAAVTVIESNPNKQDESAKLLALNVLFFNNSASGKGGAILIKRGGSLHVQNSVFDSNEASMGGAVYVQSDDDDDGVESSSFHSCATFIGAAFVGNWADLGGAIYVNNAASNSKQPGKFDCTTCSFNNNLALDDGGAIFLGGGKRGAEGNVKFSKFLNNTVVAASELTGGAIAIEAGSPSGLGVEFNSFNSTYSQNFDNEISISVKAFSNATFTNSKFLSNNTIACYGACKFCPTITMPFCLGNCGNNSISAPNHTISTTCSQLPRPICDWIPIKCDESD